MITLGIFKCQRRHTTVASIDARQFIECPRCHQAAMFKSQYSVPVKPARTFPRLVGNALLFTVIANVLQWVKGTPRPFWVWLLEFVAFFIGSLMLTNIFKRRTRMRPLTALWHCSPPCTFTLLTDAPGPHRCQSCGRTLKKVVL